MEGALGRGIGWIFWLIAGGALAAFVALITRLAAEKRGAGSTYLDRLYEDFSRWNFYYGNLERFLTLKSCPGLAPDRPRRFLRAGVAGDRRRLAGGRRHVLKKARRWKYSVIAAGSALHEAQGKLEAAAVRFELSCVHASGGERCGATDQRAAEARIKAAEKAIAEGRFVAAERLLSFGVRFRRFGPHSRKGRAQAVDGAVPPRYGAVCRPVETRAVEQSC